MVELFNEYTSLTNDLKEIDALNLAANKSIDAVKGKVSKGLENLSILEEEAKKSIHEADMTSISLRNSEMELTMLQQRCLNHQRMLNDLKNRIQTVDSETLEITTSTSSLVRKYTVNSRVINTLSAIKKLETVIEEKTSLVEGNLEKVQSSRRKLKNAILAARK